ncbi:hypothetical protein [Lacinutrix sp. Hel_I_90]|uniref:hypothetical protein n=1 Tax=Lacinutrix sp. Hel_I_90 TaxID=1249999 RepID=UPI0005C84D44|nr:hypothetical protein [Lacinutrix sp. Hel_I_90]
MNVAGIVTDDQGNILEGVTVYNKDFPNKIAITNEHGEFILYGQGMGDTIIFSHQTQEIELKVTEIGAYVVIPVNSLEGIELNSKSKSNYTPLLVGLGLFGLILFASSNKEPETVVL